MNSEDHQFPQPKDLDIPVSRYFSFEKFAWLLENERIYLPSLANLEADPFEGSLPSMDVVQRAEFLKGIGRQDLEQYYSKRIEHMRRSTYVSCWCLAETESNAMWRQYCGNDEGVAIRTKYRTLDALLHDKWRIIGLVTYLDYDTDVIPDGNVRRPFMYKRKEYESEKEVRLVEGYDPFLDPKTFEPVDASDHREIAIDPNLLVEEIIIHPNASEEYYKQIADTVTRVAPELVDRIRWSNLHGKPQF